MPDVRRYRSPTAFRQAADAKLRAVATSSGRTLAELRREFLYQRFLARVFAGNEPAWVLKGGIGLLTRLPGARHSRDIDLLHVTADAHTIEGELREIGFQDLGDHLRFEVTRSRTVSVVDGVTVSFAAYTGANVWENFAVDVSCERHSIGEFEFFQPKPVVDLTGVPDLPPFRLYPLTDQIADKVCAMYETHGPQGAPSNRYRDLVDLVLLVCCGSLDAKLLADALRARARHARSHLTLPDRMRVPGIGWEAGYPAAARRSMVSTELHRLDSALDFVGDCLNPVLAGMLTVGRWDPVGRAWQR